MIKRDLERIYSTTSHICKFPSSPLDTKELLKVKKHRNIHGSLYSSRQKERQESWWHLQNKNRCVNGNITRWIIFSNPCRKICYHWMEKNHTEWHGLASDPFPVPVRTPFCLTSPRQVRKLGNTRIMLMNPDSLQHLLLRRLLSATRSEFSQGCGMVLRRGESIFPFLGYHPSPPSAPGPVPTQPNR